MDKKEIQELLEKLNNKTISKDEFEQLKKAFEQDSIEETLFADLLPELAELSTIQANDILFETIIQDKRLKKEWHSSKDRIRTIKRIASGVAAAVVLLLGYFFLPRVFHSAQEDQIMSSKVLPGEQKAHIILADGSQVSLEDLEYGETLTLEGYTIQKDKEGRVVYSPTGEKDLVIYNNIITPIGGEYSLVLADGSEIFLNAASNLRYPIQFAKNNRTVELLEGEAYFAVNKVKEGNQHSPFKVKAKGQVITVLGTVFNVNTYNKAIVTTLLEGSIQLNNGEEEVFLKPAEQATWPGQGQTMTIQNVDPIYAVAWKNGSFAYDSASIQQVMADVSRWYNIEVQFEDNFSSSQFSGRLSRIEDIDNLLSTISLTGSVKFKREGRRVTVMK